MYTINFLLGDSSGDGHNYIKSIFLKSDYDLSFIKIAIQKASEALGFPITNLCADYDEDYIEIPIMNKIAVYCGNFFPPEISWDTHEEGNLGAYYPGNLDYAKIIIAILNATDHRLCLSIMTPEVLDGFGYGLFSE